MAGSFAPERRRLRRRKVDGSFGARRPVPAARLSARYVIKQETLDAQDAPVAAILSNNAQRKIAFGRYRYAGPNEVAMGCARRAGAAVTTLARAVRRAGVRPFRLRPDRSCRWIFPEPHRILRRSQRP
jgi:hypothetical protein